LVLGSARYLSVRSLAFGVFALIALWLLFAVGTRRPYLALLSRAIASDTFDPHFEGEPLDRASVEDLVQHLADEDPLTVVGAMNSLARRGRERLIPALVLLHQDEAILLRALQIFTESRRADWINRARRLLREPREPVRIAAARALAVHGRLEAGDLNDESSPHLRGYSALHFALERGAAQVLIDPHIAEIMAGADSVGEEAQLGLLFAIADAPRNQSLLPLVRMLDERAKASREWTEGLARAVAGQGAEDLLPSLIKRLTKRDGLEAVREALVSFGRPALQLLLRTLQDSKAERALRIQLPTSIARFGTAEAAELLLNTVESEGDGRVRYKAIRALGQLVSQQSFGLDRLRVERLSRQNLVEFFRILGLRVAFAEATSVPVPGKAFSTTGRLLLGLLDDKLRQSLERSFRLLKIAHPKESIHRVHISLVSKDPRAHAAAAEFLDTLLRFTDQQSLRKLFQVLEDDLADDERVARAAQLLELAAPATRSEALERLTRDGDATLSAIATAHVSELAGECVALDWDSLSVGQIPPLPVALHADVSHDD
jgi:HEAT repeat protein